MLLQQREFIELLRNVRFTMSKKTVEEVKERNVGIDQLQRKKKSEKVRQRSKISLPPPPPPRLSPC